MSSWFNPRKKIYLIMMLNNNTIRKRRRKEKKKKRGKGTLRPMCPNTQTLNIFLY